MFEELKFALEWALSPSSPTVDEDFTKVVSGRFPEKRGNGLKFVREVINCSKPRGLLACTGEGRLTFGQLRDEIDERVPILHGLHGVFSYFKWNIKLIVEVKKFGEILISRPAGREAAAILLSSLTLSDANELIELDFTGVRSMGPSWLHEVITLLRERYGDRIKCLPSDNASVIASLKFID